MNTMRLTIVALTLLAGTSLCAQRRAVQAHIPFDFFVGNSELMPAGTYHVAPCGTHVVKVTNCTDGLSVIHLVNDTGEPSAQGKFIFHRYGDTYFLRKVSGPASWSGLSLPVSKHEKNVQEESATVRTFETITIPKPIETAPPGK